MDDIPVQTEDWRSTKEAVANFRRLLICSKWACAGSRAGDGCVVCHSPAWVKDIQINRQLSSVIQLFSGLESLLSPVVQQPDSPVAESLTQPESPICKLKKNFKIWFSPRSRKVRCTVENKPSEVSVPESRSPGQAAAAAATTQPDNVSAQSQDLSVFNFTSSPEDSASSSSCSQRGKNQNTNKTKRATRKKAANRKASAATTTRKQSQQKKNRLEAINQQWGITEEADDLPEQLCSAENARRRSSKRVSFLSPSATPEELQPGAPQQCGGDNDLSPDGRTVRESSSGDGATVPNDQTQPGRRVSDCDVERDIVIANEPHLACDSEKLDHVSPSRRSKMEEKVPALETTPKRPRASPGRRRKSQMSPTTFNRLSSPSPGCQDESIKNSGEEQEGSPSRATVCMKSPSPRAASVGRPASGSPAYLKRNHKGESPLHLAAIKGDVEAVIELLEQGADPNLKDNAGWTPLHEACNLGHLPVVEVLVSRGALLNTPGYENDSPLHDAVRNGHPAIAKLLLQLGASQNVLNLHGKRPADYAAGLVMLEIFQEASEGTQRANTSLSPSARLSVVKDCGRRDEIVVFLTSKLSKPEQRQLAKLGKLLGGKMANTFSVSVSHVVVPEGQMPTIYSTLLALLSGCWVVKFSWVEACLQAGKWVPESEHEAGEGPQRSRINRCSLLPPLFDGCFFFLLGSFKAPPKEQLTKLLREGGGQLLSRQPKHDSDVTQTLSAAAYHAEPGSDQALCTQYILYDPQGPHKPTVVRRGKVWSAPSTWLIDCITAFRLLPVPLPQTSV